MQSSNTQGTIFNIQSYSIHDGPGIRTTVFLKGCPLRCIWCQNPESQTFDSVLFYNAEICTGCGTCLEACEQGAIARKGEKVVTLRDRCTECGACIERIGAT
ncbi:4Fe-4S dicluster domain-containing protein [Thermodesulfobacteriota bacterium]